MFKHDYILRQIEIISIALCKLLFKKNNAEYRLPEENKYTRADFLHIKLKNLINNGNINEAEDLLFDEMDKNDKRYLELAIDFYVRLNKFDDDYLEVHNYSREEVYQGLEDVKNIFGVTL